MDLKQLKQRLDLREAITKARGSNRAERGTRFRRPRHEPVTLLDRMVYQDTRDQRALEHAAYLAGRASMPKRLAMASERRTMATFAPGQFMADMDSRAKALRAKHEGCAGLTGGLVKLGPNSTWRPEPMAHVGAPPPSRKLSRPGY